MKKVKHSFIDEYPFSIIKIQKSEELGDQTKLSIVFDNAIPAQSIRVGSSRDSMGQLRKECLILTGSEEIKSFVSSMKKLISILEENEYA